MKSLSFLVSGAFSVGACLFSSCATNPGRTDACCSSGGSVAAAAGHVASAEAAALGSGKSGEHSTERSSSANKVWGHITDSTQHQAVRETKPVISNDSELRK